jgi:hypothetical protein
MRVKCDIEEIELNGGFDPGIGLVGNFRSTPGVQATCSRCNHATESYGTDSPSIRRCLVLMREECPREESNYYVAEGDDA